MESKRTARGKDGARRVISIVEVEEAVLEQRLLEAMERIERVRTKATFAVGAILAGGR